MSEEAVHSMLTASDEMKYYLRTTYGDSKNFRGHKIAIKFQGLCQGNGTAPARWAVISIVILGAHKKKGHGGHFVCPISRRTGHLSAILFVDDNDLNMLTWERPSQQKRPRMTYNTALIAWAVF